ncbi:MAG TPA: DEAD/DEAH box helicase [Candidatus Baltobacteraceae bacterium]|jgi:ATP-dependent RNA helicase DeaD|nr:DEAD/DEAH box helicase [Candidatus Baltobacteraceae bacterium]
METAEPITAPQEPQSNGFSALGLDPAILSALTSLGYEEPTAIQRDAIPPLLDGRDVLGQAATGTGKTAAFALPMLHRLGRANADQTAPRGFILVPTRELAMQVAQALHRYGKALGTRVLPIYGGQSVELQLRALRRGVDVVVATPGRALDHIRRNTLKLSSVQCLVLDEADEMLDMGFAEELEAILQSLPTERQTALFSATMARRILAIAKRHQRDPIHVMIANETAAPGKSPRVREVAYVVQRQHKAASLARVLDMEAPTSAIVFCRTRTEVDELTEALGGRGYQAEAIHGGLSQEQRDRVLRRFRENTSEILVATDVAARGLDIEHVSHVVNYDVPSSPDAYVHRIGRTGRAGREGVAVTLAEAREHRLLRNIEQHTKRKISIESIPTLHDLRTRRLELTRAALEETLESGSLEQYRLVVETLAERHDVLDLAAAAIKLADQARDGNVAKDEEIPNVVPPSAPKKFERPSGRAIPNRVEDSRDVRVGGPRSKVSSKRGADQSRETTRIYVGLGRNAGIRPTDFVNAIARTTLILERQVGDIEIADRFSLIEVPAQAADALIVALRGATIRGKKLLARRDRQT